MPLLVCSALETLRDGGRTTQSSGASTMPGTGREGKGLSRRGRPLVSKRGPEGSSSSLVARRRRPH